MPSLAKGGVRFSGRGLSRSSTSTNTLSRADLKQCLIDERAINAATAQLEHDDLVITGLRVIVDRRSAKSIARFNEEVDRYNASRELLNGLMSRFNAKCAQRSYYHDDLAAVRAELSSAK